MVWSPSPTETKQTPVEGTIEPHLLDGQDEHVLILSERLARDGISCEVHLGRRRVGE